MNTLFFLCERDGSIRTVDQPTLAALGYLNEELVGKKIWDLFQKHRRARAVIEARLTGKSRRRRRGQSLPIRVMAKDGTPLAAELCLSKVPRRSEGQDVYACLCLLKKPRGESKAEPGRHLSHEINNKLVAVKGFTQMITRDPSASAAIQEWAGEIFQAANAIQKLADEIRGGEARQKIAAPLPPPAAGAPRRAASATPPPAPGQTPSPSRPPAATTVLRSAGPRGPRRALIIEDDPAIAEVLAYYVKDYFTPVLQSSPKEALGRLRQEAFDLILTDLKMPGITGLQVLSAAREAQPETPVIIISGLTKESPEAREALALGASDFLEKPFESFEAVKAVLRKYL